MAEVEDEIKKKQNQFLTTATKGQTKDGCPEELCVSKCPSASGGGCAGSRRITGGRLSWMFAYRSTSSNSILSYAPAVL